MGFTTRIRARATPARRAGFRPVDSFRVLLLLLLTAVWTAGASAAPALVTFTDPREGAFSLKVPAKWTVRGGLFRAAADDVRVAVEAVSPDGSVQVIFGDPTVNFFVSPNVALGWAGIKEWQAYPERPNWIVARHHSGQMFAQRWGATRLEQASCRQVQTLGTRERPDLAMNNNQAVATAGLPLSFTAGESAFRCELDGKPLGAYAVAMTGRAAMGGSENWWVQFVAGVAARPGMGPQAFEVLEAMVGSFAYSQQWLRGQIATSAQTAQIQAEANRAISGIIRKTYEGSLGKYGHIEEFGRAIRGTSLFQDPVKGVIERSDRGYVFRLPNGSTVSTDSPTPPAPGAVLLERVPPGGR